MENKITKNRINKIKKQFKKELNVETLNISYLPTLLDRYKFITNYTNDKKTFLFIFCKEEILTL